MIALTYLQNGIESTRREKIIRLLLESTSPLSVKDIAIFLGIDPRNSKLIYEDLMHIAKSVRRRHKGRNLLMLPPMCSNCGYIFKEMKRLKTPSRCPRCKSEQILPPRFIIK